MDIPEPPPLEYEITGKRQNARVQLRGLGESDLAEVVRLFEGMHPKKEVFTDRDGTFVADNIPFSEALSFIQHVPDTIGRTPELSKKSYARGIISRLSFMHDDVSIDDGSFGLPKRKAALEIKPFKNQIRVVLEGDCKDVVYGILQELPPGTTGESHLMPTRCRIDFSNKADAAAFLTSAASYLTLSQGPQVIMGLLDNADQKRIQPLGK